MQDVSNLVQPCFLSIFFLFFLNKYIILGVKSAVKSMWGMQTEKAWAMESAHSCSHTEHWMRTVFHNVSSLPRDASENRTNATSALSLFSTLFGVHLCNPIVNIIYLRQRLGCFCFLLCLSLCLCVCVSVCSHAHSSGLCSVLSLSRAAPAHRGNTWHIKRWSRPHSHGAGGQPCEVVAVTSTSHHTVARRRTTVHPDYRVAP